MLHRKRCIAVKAGDIARLDPLIDVYKRKHDSWLRKHGHGHYGGEGYWLGTPSQS